MQHSIDIIDPYCRRWYRGGTRRVAAVLVGLTVLSAGCDDGGSGSSESVVKYDFGANNPDLVVAMGDSIAAGIDTTPYPTMLAGLIDKTVVNEGRSGEHAYEGRARVDDVLARYKPGFLLVLYGANDILHFRGADNIVADLRYIVRAATAAQTFPILATLTPMARSHGVFDGTAQSVSHFIRAMAAEENVLVVDLEEVFDGFDNDADPYVIEADDLLQWDGLHPNEAGNWEIALAFEPVIESVRRVPAATQP